MASTLFLILDDLSTDFRYSGPPSQDWQWTVNEQPPWYGGTSTHPAFANLSTFGSFQVSFKGTSIAFTGNTPAPPLSQSIIVTIDGGSPYNTSYMDPISQTYIQWYQSPTLAEGIHTVKVDGVDGTTLDYATITVGQNTPLSGKNIIVDNDDSTVHYSGSWTRNTDEFISAVDSKGHPFRNSTHRSTTPGDTITFLFSGTSVAVYGIFTWANIGILAATYTLDGRTPVVGPLFVTSSSKRYLDGALEDSNFQFFSSDTLSAGDHTLVINVTQCVNHAFIFDYITYTPSFSNLASMPSLVFTSPASTSASASSTASHVSQTTVGAIVGSVVGGLLALVFISLIVFWLRRRKAKENIASPFVLAPEGKPENGNTSPAQLEGQAVSNSNRSPLDSATVFPFQGEISRASAHLGLSSFANRKRERNNNFSGETSGLPPVSSTARNMNDIASSSATNPRNVASPASDVSSGLLASSPPAYEAIPTHRPPGQETQGGPG